MAVRALQPATCKLVTRACALHLLLVRAAEVNERQTGAVPRLLALRGTVATLDLASPPQAHRDNGQLVPGNSRLASDARFGVEKHVAKHAGKCRQKYRQPRNHLRRQMRGSLYLDLDLDLNLDLNPALHCALRAWFHPQFFETFFGSMLESMLV